MIKKGADLYNGENYTEAIEYYQIAAAMKNSIAVSNLGYCYLYGRGIPKDEEKAVLYFTIAARQNNIDALYKLGTFYLSGKVVKENHDLALYYLEKARSEVLEQGHDLSDYPSLCYTLASEYMKDIRNYDYREIFDLLDDAKYGFEYEIEENGATYYQKNYEEVLKMIENHLFDDLREDY